MINQKGQSLIELLIALGVFVVMVSAVGFLVLDSYISNLRAKQNARALFLAEEGLEAVRSIRDNDWEDLEPGSHGLVISGSNWVLFGESENLSDKLPEGQREIYIENIDQDRKKIISKVIWQIAPERENRIELVTYLTNWQEEIGKKKPPEEEEKEED